MQAVNLDYHFPVQPDETDSSFRQRVRGVRPSTMSMQPGERHASRLVGEVESLGVAFREQMGARCCPLCLAEKSYWRAEWEVRAVRACLLHGCYLASHCSACGRMLTWHRRNGRFNCLCGMPLFCCRPLAASAEALAVTRFVLGEQQAVRELATLDLEGRCRLVRMLGMARRSIQGVVQSGSGSVGLQWEAIADAAGTVLGTGIDPVEFLFCQFATALDPDGGETHRAVASELFRIIESEVSTRLAQRVRHWSAYPDGFDHDDRVYLCWVPHIFCSYPIVNAKFLSRHLAIPSEQACYKATRVPLSQVLDVRSRCIERLSIPALRERWGLPAVQVAKLLRAYGVRRLWGPPSFSAADVEHLQNQFQRHEGDVHPQYHTYDEARAQGASVAHLDQLLCSDGARSSADVVIWRCSGRCQFLVARAAIMAVVAARKQVRVERFAVVRSKKKGRPVT